MIAHDETGVQFLDGPRRREAAFCHSVLSHCYADGALRAWWGRRYAHCRLHRSWLSDRVHDFGDGESSPAT